MVADATILSRAPPLGQSNMSMAQSRNQFGYRRHPDQDRAGANAAEHPVVVVGAGPVGLSLAIDLAQRGQSVVLLDDADRIREPSPIRSAAPAAWWTRAWCGASAGFFTAPRSSINSTCCRSRATR